MTRRNNKNPRTNRDRPLISVVIPAYNEARCIASTLACVDTAAAEYDGPVEIIVVDNNSTDDTGAIARSLNATVVLEPKNQIARARNTGARAASGEFLIFLDADTRLEGDILAKVARNLASGQVIGGGAWIDSDSNGLARIVFKYGVNYLLALKNVALGPFIYCEREAFLAAGGFNEELYAAEEFALAKRMQAEGRKVNKKWKIIRHAKGHNIITSSRRFGRFGGLEMALKNVHLLWKTGQKLRQKDQCAFWYKARM